MSDAHLSREECLMNFDVTLMFLRIGYLTSHGFRYVYSNDDIRLLDRLIYRHYNEA